MLGFGNRDIWEHTAATDAAVHQLAWDTERARSQASRVCSPCCFLRVRAEAAEGVPARTGPGAKSAGGKPASTGALADGATRAAGTGAESAGGNEAAGEQNDEPVAKSAEGKAAPRVPPRAVQKERVNGVSDEAGDGKFDVRRDARGPSRRTQAPP